MKIRLGDREIDLGRVAQGAALVAAGVQVVNDVAPEVVKAIAARSVDLEKGVVLASVGLAGRKVGPASPGTVDLFVRAMAALAMDLRNRRKAFEREEHGS